MTNRSEFTDVLQSRDPCASNGIVINIDPIDPEPTPIQKEFICENTYQHYEHHGNSEGFKTLTAFLCLMLSAFLNFFLLTVIHDVVPREPLPDLTFMIIPQQRWAWSVGDVLSTVSSIVAFTIIFLHHQRWIVLRRTFILGAIMYGLRAVILGVTFLPPSFHNRDEICQPQVNRTAMYGMEIATRFLTYVITLGLTSGQDKILCGDLMFSGHTVVLTIMYFVQLQYTPRGLVILRYIAAPITFLGIGALVVSGGHYTMDVLIAYWLTSHVFWSYHQIFEMKKEDRPQAPLSRLWWFWLCYWFESDVSDGKLINKWSWPLESPQKMHSIMNRINLKLQ
ncbi:Protein CBR-SMS-2 [Caenorhabditis briggsae]|uniref:Protein CBR-SMS-2 n=1 Tax=Caenorhabditis briggsae TaxID=6238 RepID=A8X5S1_CAEBR|nr:Protein CBR-SMS-2 [Caenorhabditis briggsae]CAP27982.1 Protein CBR-SMS-2 [Caenorhabditis briggsae]